MWSSSLRGSSDKKNGLSALVAVAIDKDKSSQHALKWATEHLLVKGQTVVLIHVIKHHSSSAPSGRHHEHHIKDLFLPFRCFCTRKFIQCKDVILEDTDVAKALIDYVADSAIEILVLGSPSKGGFLRFSRVDVPTTVSKGAPEFCTIYIISKGKISSMRSASRQAPQQSELRSQIMSSQSSIGSVPPSPCNMKAANERHSIGSPFRTRDDMDIGSPFTRGGKHPQVKSYGELSAGSDISFIGSGRSSVDHCYYDTYETGRSQNRVSTSSDVSSDYPFDLASRRSVDSSTDFSVISDEMSGTSWSSSHTADDVQAEMRRLRLELKHTMDLYGSICKEALTAKQKAMEQQKLKHEEKQKMEEAQSLEGAAFAVVDKEKVRSNAAVDTAAASHRIAERESQKRMNAEMNVLREAEEEDGKMSFSDANYRRYTIEEIEVATEYFAQSRKIGEGGYGPVFRGILDHTPVAIKVLRPDAAQGRSQFQQEVKVLSCIRHPHMVLLLGACPEYGCLVYEHMHNGSLDDRLFCKGGTPPIPWQHRFRIAAEIGTALLFLHQTKPEPLVHRDLKPANILLDRNLVSKISDVGLARLVPPSVADSVTQYRVTSAAGTFCYIDPEYQQTGMLGVKSDVYSLGILLLQIIAAKPPMGLSHHVEHAIENGAFEDMLDPLVQDWPVEEAKSFAEMAIKCAELRRKDRPDLGSVVLPELCRLRTLGEESLDAQGFGWH